MSTRFLNAVMFALLLTHLSNAAELELPYLIGEGMVVQRGEPIPIWGWADANSKIEIEFNGMTKIAIADENGNWRVVFDQYKAGGPYSLSVASGNASHRFKDIWVGDVWVCSGQSNMEWPLQLTDNAEMRIATANDALIRHFKVPKSWATSPQGTLQGGEWQSSSPETAAHFSAVGYYFAKRIREEVDIPIGLLNSSWGGSNIESWMDAPLLGMTREENSKILNTLADEKAVEVTKVKRRVAQWPNAYSADYKNAASDWSAEKLDESDWIEIETPLQWEEQNFPGLDGVVWYRKTFTLTEAQAQQALELGLARIDDQDRTWVNGVEVGHTEHYNEVRSYKVPSKIVHPGSNTIAIRVLDTGGGGGIYSDTNLLYLRGKNVDISLAGTWLFKIDKGYVTNIADRNHTATALYNKMMHPLYRIPVKGVLWYQGESNALEADQAYAYRDQFQSLISDWRKKWHNKNLPFYWVQLANFISGADTENSSPWAILRESQTQALSLPHTGQAVTIDIGNPKDIHPRNKKAVGERLARHALKNEYKKKNMITRGPYFSSAKRKGDRVIVKMKAQAALRISRGTELLGFEMAGENGKWMPANARLEKNTIVLSSSEVISPVSIRYAWRDNPELANLGDASGLPAEPFRKIKL